MYTEWAQQDNSDDLCALVRNLPVNSAACAIHLGDIELAMELLEQGQNVLASVVTPYRSFMDDLEAAQPNLVNEFKAVSEKIESPRTRKGRCSMAHGLEDESIT